MRRILATAGAVTAIAAAALMGSVGTASASPADCPPGSFCAWSDDDFSGAMAQWAGNDNDWTNDGMHDNAESLYNNGVPGSLTSVQTYYDANFVNQDVCVNRGETYDFAMNDNDYDSHRWVPGCT